MPQLDFSTYAPQLVWLLITFVVLYLLMARMALPAIATVLEERRDRIANDLDKAEQLRRETDEAIAAHEAALAEARARAHEIANAMREKLAAEIDVERQKAEATISARADEADAAISAAKVQAIGEVSGIATETAEAIVKQLVGGRWTKAKIAGAIDTAMKH